MFIVGYKNGSLLNYTLNSDTFSNLKNEGMIKGHNLILLVHGFTRADETVKLMEFHSLMTPNETVLMIDWRTDIDNYYSWWYMVFYLRNYYRAAWFAVKFEINDFLMNFKTFEISCIGHSLGSHMCASICRNFRSYSKRQCARIVGLDIASMGFWRNGELKSFKLSKADARYVVGVMTTNFYGLRDPYIAHEYITSNINGKHIEECPSSGKFNATVCGTNIAYETFCMDFSIGTGEATSCAHTMPVLIFAQSLDIYSSFTVLALDKFNKVRQVSGWNGYVMSTDRMSHGVFPNWLSTNESAYYPLAAMIVKLASNSSYLECKGFDKFELMSGSYNEWVAFHNRSMFVRDIECSSDSKVVYVKTVISEIRYVTGFKFIQKFVDSENCSVDYGLSRCYLDKGISYSVVPRMTIVSHLYEDCIIVKPSSSFHTFDNYTLFTSSNKSVEISFTDGAEYVIVNDVIVADKGRHCRPSIHKVSVGIKRNMLKLKFMSEGIHNVKVIYPYTVVNYTVLVGNTVLMMPTESKQVKFPYRLRAHVKTCKRAKWFKNGIFTGSVGCELIVNSAGYYRYSIKYDPKYELIGDFAINL